MSLWCEFISQWQHGEEDGWLLQDWAIAGRCDREVDGVEMSPDRIEDPLQERGKEKMGREEGERLMAWAPNETEEWLSGMLGRAGQIEKS